MRRWNVAEVGVSAWRGWELGVFSLLAEDSKPEAETTVSPEAYAKDNDKNIVKECRMSESLSGSFGRKGLSPPSHSWQAASFWPAEKLSEPRLTVRRNTSPSVRPLQGE